MVVRQAVFVRIVLLAVLMVSFVAACGDREEPAVTETATDTVMGTAVGTVAAETDTAGAASPASPGGTALVPSTASGTTVVVLLEDGRIAVQTSAIPAGPAVLTVTNGGTQVHSLAAEGPGNVSKMLEEPIDRNVRNTLDIDLVRGTWTFYCPVGDHRARGESVEVTIPSS